MGCLKYLISLYKKHFYTNVLLAHRMCFVLMDFYEDVVANIQNWISTFTTILVHVYYLYTTALIIVYIILYIAIHGVVLEFEF